MQTPRMGSSSRFSIRHLVGILALGAALAACDRHRAQEVPESYGHGSAHRISYSNHWADTRNDPPHFSDTQGAEIEGSPAPAVAKPSPAPGGTPGGHFF